jgi:hypothetical protein
MPTFTMVTIEFDQMFIYRGETIQSATKRDLIGHSVAADTRSWMGTGLAMIWPSTINQSAMATPRPLELLNLRGKGVAIRCCPQRPINDAEFRRQVATIDAEIAEIRRLFRDGWIDVIAPNGTPLSFSQILDRLSIQPRFRMI